MRIADLAGGFPFGFETLNERIWLSHFVIQKAGLSATASCILRLVEGRS
jgi:hypothetical protein